MAITKIDNFFIFNKIGDTFEKYFACKNTFFLLIQKKVVLLQPISLRVYPKNVLKNNQRKGARVVEEARLESE